MNITNMKAKIKTEEVRRAYNKTGLTPVQCSFGHGTAACALAALYYHSKNINCSGGCPTLDHDVEEWAQRKFGKFFVNGFIEAFDGVEQLNQEQIQEAKRHKECLVNLKRGFLEGRRIRRAIIGK